MLAFLIPLAVGAMARGWISLLPVMEEELAASRSVLGIALLGGTLGWMAAPLVDWKGSRLLIVIGGSVAALGLLVVSAASSLPMMVTGGFLASAGVGLSGSIVIRVLVADWFIQYRGTFLGLALLGSGMGGWFGRFLVWVLAELGSWRLAEGILALAGAGVAVAAFALIHNYPARGEEDAPGKARVPGRRSPQLERMIPAGQYLRSPGLWRAFGLLALALVGIYSVRWWVMQTAGWDIISRIDSTLYPVFNEILPIGIVIGGFGWSVTADFWPRNRLFWQSASAAVVSLALLSVPFIFFALGGLGIVALFCLVFLAGVFLGGLSALITLTFIDYMGVKFLGTLSLAFVVLTGAGDLQAPFVTGILFDAFGSSSWIILMSLPLVVLAALAATRAPYPVVELKSQVSLP